MALVRRQDAVDHGVHATRKQKRLERAGGQRGIRCERVLLERWEPEGARHCWVTLSGVDTMRQRSSLLRLSSTFYALPCDGGGKSMPWVRGPGAFLFGCGASTGTTGLAHNGAVMSASVCNKNSYLNRLLNCKRLITVVCTFVVIGNPIAKKYL